MALFAHYFDVLCLQETFLTGWHGDKYEIPGFKLLEQRRERGTRGGIAILVRSSLPVLAQKGNEYAQ